jgi:hypothetical protein
MQFRFVHAGLAGVPAFLVVDQAPSPMTFAVRSRRRLALDRTGSALRQQEGGNEHYRTHGTILPGKLRRRYDRGNNDNRARLPHQSVFIP